MNVSVGDTIPVEELDSVRTKNEWLIYNTGMFNVVKIRDSVVANNLFWEIFVEERWYILPFFWVDVAEQTPQDWLKDKDFNRITLAGGIAHSNLTGRMDMLAIQGKIGYTQALAIFYNKPFFIPNYKIDAKFLVNYERQREIIAFSQQGNLVRQRLSANYIVQTTNEQITFRRRLSQYKFIYASFRHSYFYIHDSLLLINPDFLGYYNDTTTNVFSQSFGYQTDTRDIRSYPSKGSLFSIKIGSVQNKKNLGIFTDFYISKHLNLFGTRFYYSVGFSLYYNSLKNIPYKLKYELSKNVHLRGFRSLYIDGNLISAFQQEIRFALIPRHIVQIKRLPKAFRHFPLGLYPFVGYDAGFVGDNTTSSGDNYYKNRILSATFVGLDFITFYDAVLRCQLMYNNFSKVSFLVDMGIYIR